MSKIPIVDAQVDFGKNVFGPDSVIDDYIIQASKQNITKAILIPTGTHELILDNGTIEKSCVWYKKNDVIIYRRIVMDNRQKILLEELNPKNPYLHMNNHVYRKLLDLNRTEKDILFYFCPKVHPLLDSPQEIIRILSLEKIVALKIQGLSSYSYPQKIPKWLIGLLKERDIPLIVHTDYRLMGRSDSLDDIILKNSANNWVKWLTKHKLRAYLAHGLRLDPPAIKIVNRSDLFVVGTGPDFILNLERDSLVTQNVDYLTYLLSRVDENKICFSSDYRWNVFQRGDWVNLDWNTIERIENYAARHQVSTNFIKNILHDNAVNFFNLS